MACRGDDMDRGLKTLDVRGAQAELDRLDKEPTGSHTAATREALVAQLATAARMQAVSTDARDRLRLLDARLDELVARAVELSVSGSASAISGWATTSTAWSARWSRSARRSRRRTGPTAGMREARPRRGRARERRGAERPATPPRCQLSVALGTLLSRRHRAAAGHRLRHRHRPERAGRRLRRRQQLPQLDLRAAASAACCRPRSSRSSPRSSRTTTTRPTTRSSPSR